MPIDPTRRYRLDGTDLIKNPVQKRWARQSSGNGSNNVPIFNQCWELSLSFPVLYSRTEYNVLMGHYLSGTVFSAILPHPKNGDLYQFSSVSVSNISGTFTDIDNDNWVQGVSMVLRVCDVESGSYISA